VILIPIPLCPAAFSSEKYQCDKIVEYQNSTSFDFSGTFPSISAINTSSFQSNCEFIGLQMKAILKILFLLLALSTAVPLLAQSDYQATKARAARGDAVAQYSLGAMYYTGEVVAQDYQEAARWWRFAAEQRQADAQLWLGLLHEDGKGVAKDDREAARYYQLAASQRNAYAQFRLGLMFANGTGVLKNGEEAVRWFRFAAEQGNIGAQDWLGHIYFYGQQGVTVDYQESFKWSQLAANQNNASSQV
jgi:TPR repeat protein